MAPERQNRMICCCWVPTTSRRYLSPALVLGAIAEFEHGLMAERTRVGLAATRARAVPGEAAQARPPPGQDR